MEREPTAAFKGLSGQIRVHEEDPWLWITLLPCVQVQRGSKEKTFSLSFHPVTVKLSHGLDVSPLHRAQHPETFLQVSQFWPTDGPSTLAPWLSIVNCLMQNLHSFLWLQKELDNLYLTLLENLNETSVQ